MSTLYGLLNAHLHAEFERQTSALTANAALINSFDEVARPLNLEPHVKPNADRTVALVARCERNRDREPVLTALQGLGFRIGEPIKPTLQLNDGYTMWCVDVIGSKFSFQLLFYTPVEVC